MDQSAVMGESWRLVWRRKSLFGFGCLSILATGLGYLAFYALLIGLFLGSSGLFAAIMRLPEPFFEALPFSPWWYALAIGGALFWLLTWLVGLAARGGLVIAVAALDEGGQPEGALGRGWRRAPALAAMAFVLFLPVTLFTLAAQAGAFALLGDFFQQPPEEMMRGMAGFYLVFYSLMCVNYALTLFLQFIYPFAFRGVALRGLGVRAAIRHGWRVLRANLNAILPLAALHGVLLLLLYGLVYGAFFVLYFALIFMAVGAGGDFSPALLGVVGMAFMGLLFVVLVAGAILFTWRSTTFTLGYRRWTAPKAESEAPVS